jgi:hypothetical protein
MTRHNRLLMHDHLRKVLTDVIGEALCAKRTGASVAGRMPHTLAARHVASTFVLVLDWWLDDEPALTPQQVDGRFRKLVLPILATI